MNVRAKLAALVISLSLCGCGGSGGGGGNPPAPPAFTGNTAVTVVMSSTANSQLQQFTLGFASLSLVRQDGTTVNLLTAKPDPNDAFSSFSPEFLHRNGSMEPLITVSVPQGVYTSATATFDDAVFNCVTLTTPSGGLSIINYGVDGNPQSVTLSLPSPITITGSSMGLALNLLVSQSANFASCQAAPVPAYTITPSFTVTPVNLAATDSITNYDAEVSSVTAAGGKISVAPAFNPFSSPIAVTTGSSTVYQGIAAGSALTSGMFVNMDMTTQADGSLLATRISVENPSAIAMATGPVLFKCGAPSCPLNLQSVASQGTSRIVPYGGGSPFLFDSASFHIYPAYDNVASLPFPAAFSAATMAAGQAVSITTGAPNLDGATQANTITLVPQTINGTVNGIAQQGNFQVYTVTLAAYDNFPALAVQAGQTTALTTPNTVEVYVDSSAQALNTIAIASGKTTRFTGLVFNDGGALRMDCKKINDGVAE